MTNDQKLSGPTQCVGVFTAAKLIVYRLVDSKYQLLMVKKKKDGNNSYYTFLGGKRQSSETPWECLFRELEEETDGRMDYDTIFYCPKSAEFKVQIFTLNVNLEDCIINIDEEGELLYTKWIPLEDVEVLTNGFWKVGVVKGYILESLEYYAICPVCNRHLNTQSQYVQLVSTGRCFCHVECYTDEDDDYEDEYFSDQDEDLDDYSYEPGPCDDCDDKKMPYAARSCEDCEFGGKGCLGTLKVNRKDFDEDDDYILDMWGPDAVNRRHGV